MKKITVFCSSESCATPDCPFRLKYNKPTEVKMENFEKECSYYTYEDLTSFTALSRNKRKKS